MKITEHERDEPPENSHILQNIRKATEIEKQCREV